MNRCKSCGIELFFAESLRTGYCVACRVDYEELSHQDGSILVDWFVSDWLGEI